MTTIVTRAGKGSPLTNNELDQNFINLNDAKYELPSVTGNSGKFLTTNGTTTSWGTVDLSPYLTSATAVSTYVALTGDQTIGGTKTFSSTITGSISGNAGTVTNGVYTSGSYADPTWITSLAETKVLPTQTGNSGKFLTTNGTSTSWGTVTPANDGTLTLAVSGTGLSGSATFTANQAGNSTFTVTSNATSANTASTIVARDASGNFSAGTITATLSGNASTVTDGVYLSTNQTISGIKTFSVAPVFNNDVGIQAKDTGGTTRNILRLNSANNVLFVNGGGASILFRNQADSSTIVTIDNSGNLTAAGNVTANSDERLKENIKLIPDALAKVESVRGVTFTRKSDGSAGIGVIAQEIQKVAPEAVIVGEDGMMSVAYGNLVGLLIEAVKELSAEVKELKARG